MTKKAAKITKQISDKETDKTLKEVYHELTEVEYGRNMIAQKARVKRGVNHENI